jgi:alpha-N-arabinofuranosidase
VRIACIAQLVNVIAPIRAERGGPAWRTPVYYPYQFASLHGRGTALNVSVDAPTYDCAVADDVSYLDAAAVHDRANGTVTAFLVNRHLDEAASLELEVGGFDKVELASHATMGGQGLREANTPEDPDRIVPREGTGLGVEDGRLVGTLPPLSYHVVRLRCA